MPLSFFKISFKYGDIGLFKVVGGSVLSAKVRWSQKMLYQDGQVCLTIPFSFPLNVNPVVKKLSKKEKIILNVNSGTGTVVCCQSASHPLQVRPFSDLRLVLCKENCISLLITLTFISFSLRNQTARVEI